MGTKDCLWELLGRKSDSRQLRNELFCLWGMKQRNLALITSHLGRFWVLPLLYSFLEILELQILPGLGDFKWKSSILEGGGGVIGGGKFPLDCSFA